MPERTYRLSDGELIYGEYEFVTVTDFFDDADACDVIEEEWVLVRSRTLRVGESELCSLCGGDGELGDGTAPPSICLDCGGTGTERRDGNPPWTETDDARALRIGRAVQGCRYDPVHQRVIFPDGTWAATAQGLHAALLAAGEAT